MNLSTTTRRALTVILIANLWTANFAQFTPRKVQAGPNAALDGSMRLAVLGDYGFGGPDEAQVAKLVHFWGPDMVLTVGDNNYPDGEASTIDANVGQFYRRYIGNYQGSYGVGSSVNNFFPALGNHDWHQPGAQPYLDYFTLPGNERYYEVRRGPVHAFVLDSDSNEPDGVTADSLQAAWLEAALQASNAPYKFVFTHHAPFSSSAAHGPQSELQWDYAEWGADAVFAGHDHLYERLEMDGIAYFVNGLGGTTNFYDFQNFPTAGSRERYQDKHGAILIEADPNVAVLRFVTKSGAVVDQFRIYADDPSQATEFLVPRGANWAYYDQSSVPPLGWSDPGFDDSPWPQGPAEFGYGEGDEATVVSFGPSATNKFITTYYRRSFQVSDPASITDLRMDLQLDDGALIYLNGTELLRINLYPGQVLPQTLAASEFSGNIEDSFYEFDIDPALLANGVNHLAVEVHQGAPDTSDQSFDMALSAKRGAETFVAAGAHWSYLDDGMDPGPAWFKRSFDDTGWAVGPGEFGYGDNDQATLIDFGPDALNKHITTWFRHTFSVSDASQWKALFLRLVRDDGVVVYLNGHEVHRYNLPLLGSTSATTADAAVSDEDSWFETRIDHGALIDGINLLAVEVHQRSKTSSDLSFNLELVGRP